MKISVFLATAPKAAKSATDGKTHQVCFRVREGDSDMRVRSGILVNPSLWDSSVPGYRRTARLPKEEVEAINRQVSGIIRLIHDGYTPDRDASWLRALVENALNTNGESPDKSKMGKDANGMIALFHRYFAGLRISKGRLGGIMGTIKKLERYQAFRREVMGEASFTLDVNTLTTAGVQEIWDYIMEEHRHYAEHPDFYNRFNFMRNKAPVPLSHNYMTSVFRHIRAFLNWTLRLGITTNERWKGFTVRNEVYGTPVYLTLEERDRLLALDLRVFPRLERHRDMFIFQSLVGCRVGDLYRLTSDNIRDGFLEYCPRKTIGRDGNVYGAVTCRVPLNDKALALLAKYEGKCGKALFPCLNKILYGEDIKVVAMIAGLDRMVSVLDKKTAEVKVLPLFMAITTHTARKTFIANLYLRVKDPNLIASMTGHATNSKAFRRYRAISEQLKRELTARID